MIQFSSTESLCADKNDSDDINHVIDKVRNDHIESVIQHLQNYGNRMTWEKQWETAEWLNKQMESLGLFSEIQTYEHKDKLWPNVIAEIEGNDKKDEIIMAIAHLDSISYDPDKHAPGADDNGTGVAAILELVRILKDVPMNRAIKFAIFSNEERGTAGSKAFVKNTINEGLNIQAVLNLDVLGYNRPHGLPELDAIKAQYDFKHKLKAIYLMTRNYLYGLFKGPDVLKVAGKPQNAKLVKIVTKAITDHSKVKVEKIIRDDCG